MPLWPLSDCREDRTTGSTGSLGATVTADPPRLGFRRSRAELPLTARLTIGCDLGFQVAGFDLLATEALRDRGLRHGALYDNRAVFCLGDRGWSRAE